MTIRDAQQAGRAKNAVLSFLEQRLSIPKIYIDADWDGHHVDVLAINREGVGDVHVVLLYERGYFDNGLLDVESEFSVTEQLLAELSAIPAQFKYIGVIEPAALWNQRLGPPQIYGESRDKLLAPDGLGRVGLLQISINFEEPPSVMMSLAPERFRAKIAKLAGEFLEQHEADWEIRA